ncbi:MAG: YkvA family protein [Rhizobiaceae bacterium]
MDKSEQDKILLPVPSDKIEARDTKVRVEFWPKFKKFAAQLPLAEDFAAAYFCATDKSTPLKVRGTLLAALAYFIMPIDLVPDILALVGFTDDIAVLTAALTLVQSHVTEEHREKAREAIQTNTNT